MIYLDKIQQIDKLQSKILENGPIPTELLNKINYKLRLEWNYTSNSMEGNSLTKRETRTVMVNAIEVNGKPIKDITEIKKHDKVISTIMKLGKGDLNISESRIKEIHKGIMYEDDPEKQKQIGQWKNVNNFMTNVDEERFDFVQYTEVAERMHQLINWTNSEKEKIQRKKNDAIHPIILASKFHIDYVTIHPFYDGNGRTARILTNLILISFGYPPLYINESEKQNYYRYLTDIQADGGQPNLFYGFMADRLLRSVQIVADAIDGKNIDEDDDIDKEIALFKRSLDKSQERKETRNWGNISEIINIAGIALFQKFIDKLSQFDELFQSCEHRIIFTNNNLKPYDLEWRTGGAAISTANFPGELLTWLQESKDTDGYDINIGIEYFLKAYKFSKPYDLPVFIQFSFKEYFYDMSFMIMHSVQSHHHVEKNYDQLVNDGEINGIVNDVSKRILEIIKGK